jgi:two-component system sensor histidine kinase ChvG
VATEQPATKQPLLSPITWRILGVNLLALAILVAGLLYLGEYRRGLIAAEQTNLGIQAEVVATALAESGTNADDEDERIDSDRAAPIVRRLSRITEARVRLFSPDADLIADSRTLQGPGGVVQVEALPAPLAEPSLLDRLAGPLIEAYVEIADWLPGREKLPVYQENPDQKASDYYEAVLALTGEEGTAVRDIGAEQLIITAASPVQRYKKVLGAVMLSRDSTNIDQAIYEVRVDILGVFAGALLVTVLLSLYLAGTIARPLHRLAVAAELVRRGHNRHYAIPDFAGRTDEIGNLAHALRDMTAALWARMDAIEGFAADVAHEIKNPLTSVRSAVETAGRVKDPEHLRRLLNIILDDVQRLDVLISGISDASRLDAELSRMDERPVDLVPVLETLINMHEATSKPGAPALVLEPPKRPLVVTGMESRLVQVLRNLIANAISFSPPNGVITMRATSDEGWIRIQVDDQGPGIPAGKEEAIFQRFYSERPPEEFGTHSGLGLSISRQIVEAHGGTIRAENLTGEGGEVRGCRFTVRLPAAKA